MLYRNDTLCGIFHNQALRYGDTRAFLTARFNFDGSPSSSSVSLTWSQVREAALALARGFLALGIEHSDRVMIYSDNRPHWIITDQAIQACGAIGVPIYNNVSLSELSYMIYDCAPSLLVACDVARAGELRSICEKNEKLSKVPIIIMEPADTKEYMSFSQVMELGRQRVPLDTVEDGIQRVIPSDMASIIYTSGAAGHPKGVVLTQANWVSNIHQCTSTELMQCIEKGDLRLKTLSHLPLNHVYARAVDYHVVGLHFGGELVFARGYEALYEEMLQHKPNVLTSIPRVFEKIALRVNDVIRELSWMNRAICTWALKQGEALVEAQATGKRISPLRFAALSLADLLVLRRIRRMIGLDKLVFAISGGGKLSKDVCVYLRSLGLQLVEGYGLTETGTVINFNNLEIMGPKPHSALGKFLYNWVLDTTEKILIERQSQGFSVFSSPLAVLKTAICYYAFTYRMRVKPGLVGRPLPDTLQRIEPDGEVFIKGPQVFSGYWRLPVDTDEAFTEDGWFKTGDLGRIDDEGFLEITGRKKELLVTAGGKNIAPHPIEKALCERAYINQVCVVGDARPYLTALIVPDVDSLKDYARKNTIDCSSVAALLENPGIKTLIDAEVEAVNQALARSKQIKYFTLLEAFTGSAEASRAASNKAERERIVEQYRDIIERMYNIKPLK